MRFNHSPQASRRDAGVIDLRAHVLNSCSYFRQIARHIDRHYVRLSTGRIVQIDLTQLVVHQTTGATRQRMNIRFTRILQALRHGLLSRVIFEQRH